MALRFWLGLGSPSWLENQYRVLRTHCERNGSSPAAALAQVVQGTLALRNVTKLAHRYQELVGELDIARQFRGKELVDYLFPAQSGWAQVLREAALVSLTDDTNAAELHEMLRGMITQPEIPDSPDYVRVMSLHKSKGLTSKVTIVAGVVQGMVPLILEDGSEDDRQESLKEQRRVFYVAVTRATDILVISSVRVIDRDLAHKMRAKVTTGAGAYGMAISSQFIHELGPNAPAVQAGVTWQRKGFK